MYIHVHVVVIAVYTSTHCWNIVGIFVASDPSTCRCAPLCTIMYNVDIITFLACRVENGHTSLMVHIANFKTSQVREKYSRTYSLSAVLQFLNSLCYFEVTKNFAK